MRSFKNAGRRNVIPHYPPVLRDGRELRCESCGRLFTSTDALRQHVALTHTGRRPHACPICGKRYGQVYHLQAHFKLHREPRLQVCYFMFYKRGIPRNDMRFPTMWYMRPAKPQISLRVRAVGSEPLLVA